MEKTIDYPEMSKEEREVARWHDKYAKQYSHSANDERYRFVEEQIMLHHDVLNLGCASGTDLIHFADKCESITGVDFSKEMITEANRKSLGMKNVSFVRANILKLPFKDETFDLTYSFSTLYYIKDLKQAFKEVNRVLKSGGVFIFDFGNKNSINNYWDAIKFKVPQHNTTLIEVRKLLKQTGFKEELVRHYQLHPLTRKRNVIKPLNFMCFRRLMIARKE